MALGYRAITTLLALPFAAYAVASVVQSYRPVFGASVAKAEPLPLAEDFTKGRDRVVRIAAGAQAVADAAFAYSPEDVSPDLNLPDDLRKLARGTTERNQVLENLRLFLGGVKNGFRGTTAKQFETAVK